MTTLSPRIVIVDTNCFLRLYQSPILPLLGQDVGGYRLLTLESLINEFLDSTSLTSNYPWLVADPKFSDLENAKLKIRAATRTTIDKQIKSLTPYAKLLLEQYCKKKNIIPRTLSGRDIELMATVIAVKGVMATDEWPLRHVASELMQDPITYNIEIFSSLDLLHLLEVNGKLTADERRTTVDSWVRLKENLLKGWEADYERLFGESADSLGV